MKCLSSQDNSMRIEIRIGPCKKRRRTAAGMLKYRRGVGGGMAVTELTSLADAALRDGIEQMRQLVDWLAGRNERRAAALDLLTQMEDELARRRNRSTTRRGDAGARLA